MRAGRRTARNSVVRRHSGVAIWHLEFRIGQRCESERGRSIHDRGDVGQSQPVARARLRDRRAAADAGAHAVKLQTYTADTMTLDVESGEFVIRTQKSLWERHAVARL